MSAHDEELLRCYLEELSYLRRMGERFAREHPKIARRLELQADECPDPHVERLIESFAFLTARIQNDLENDFPEIATELLDILYPNYLNPIPSMTVVRFDVEPKLTEPVDVPRHTPLFVHTTEGDVCRFRTCYPATLWPIEVVDAKFVEASEYEFPARRRRAASVLKLTLKSLSDPFEVLGVDRLRFYLHGDMVVNRLYALLLEGERRRVTVVPRGAETIPDLPYLEALQVGFAEDEEVIHYPRQGHPAYRLLQEYFAFEEKFHFVDVTGLRGRARGQEIDLLFLLDHEPRGRILVSPESFVLGCTPAVNLFETTSEPIRVDQRRTDYRLVADHRRERSVDIHSIRSVSGSSDAAKTSREYAPFYSYTHAMARENQTVFWHARRVPSLRAGAAGTDIFLSFHDSAFDPGLPPDEIVFAHLLCSNGALAPEIPAGKHLQTDEALPVTQIINLRKPTQPLSAPLGGQSLWRLVSHLSLNYLSLEGEKGTAALREILLLYCNPDSRSQRQRIEGIKSVASEKVVRRLPGSDWNGFARGTKVTVTLDENLFASSNAFLLASVLSHFLGLHASINSFTQLVIRREGDERDAASEEAKGRRWPVMVGGRAVL
jgi:type VI secretion system protein ImpG